MKCNHIIAVFSKCSSYIETLHTENQDEQYIKGHSPSERFEKSE